MIVNSQFHQSGKLVLIRQPGDDYTKPDNYAKLSEQKIARYPERAIMLAANITPTRLVCRFGDL